MDAPRSPLELLLYNTVKLDAITADNKIRQGTCFFFSYLLDDKKNHIDFLVTNKHVIQDCEDFRLIFKRNEPDKPFLGNPQKIFLPDFGKYWIKHPDDTIDLAVLTFSQIINMLKEKGRELHYSFTIQYQIPSIKWIDENLDAVEDVFFVGYPMGLQDEANILPVFRKGITATPVYIDFNNTPTFLIDASVFPGSSGSPVFVLKNKGEITKNGTEIKERILLILGVLAGSYREGTTQQEIDVGIAYKAHLINDLCHIALSK